jgi:hypothetical protein
VLTDVNQEILAKAQGYIRETSRARRSAASGAATWKKPSRG